MSVCTVCVYVVCYIFGEEWNGCINTKHTYFSILGQALSSVVFEILKQTVAWATALPNPHNRGQ